MPPKGPFPRTFQIEHTDHSRQRGAERTVSHEEIEAAICTGAEKTLPGTGGHGGKFVRFSKGSVVVIAEVVNNVCYVVTTYHA